MALNSLGLGFLFSATDMASGVMDKIKSNFTGLSDVSGQSIDSLDDKVKKLAGGLTAAATGAAGLAVSYKLAGEAGKLETALTNVKKVTAASGEEMAKMEAAAHKLGKQLGVSPTAAVEGMRTLATQGYDTTEILRMLPDVLKFAAASDISVASATDILGQALKGFSIDARLATAATDQMQAASNAMAMDVPDLAIAFGRLSAGVHSVGGSLTDGLTVFGLVKNALGSIQLSATGTSLSFERLSNPKVLQAMKALGVQVLDANGNFKNVPLLLGEISEHMKKLGGEAKQSAFLEKVFGRDGKKAVSAFFAQLEKGIKSPLDGITRTGKAAVADMLKYIASADGTNAYAAEVMMARYEGVQNRLSATTESFLQTVGKPFISIWTPILETLTRAVDWMDEKIQAMPDTWKNFGAGVMVAFSAFLLLGGVIATIMAAWPLLEAAWIIGSVAMTAFRVALVEAAIAFWPITLAIAAIAIAVYAAQNNVGGLGDYLSSFAEKAGVAFSWIGEKVGQVFSYIGGVWQAFTEGLSWMWALVSPIFRDLGKAFDGIGDTLNMFFTDASVLSDEDGPGGAVAGIFRIIGAAIGFASGVLGFFLTVIVKVIDYVLVVGGVIFNVFRGVVNIFTVILGKIEKFLGGFESLHNLFKSPLKPEVAPVVPEAEPPPAPNEEAPAVAAATKAKAKSPFSFMDQPEDLSKIAGGQTVMPGRAEVVFDYDKLAVAIARQPITIAIDGVAIASAARNAELEDKYRGGRRDPGDLGRR